MKITAIAPWFGSKRTLAPKIVEVLGPHRAYWEPFCGSMAVLLAKPPCASETVNDLHGDLINLARVIRDPQLGPMLYRRLRRVNFGRPMLMEARERLTEMPPPSDVPEVRRAEAYFIDAWQSMNGLAGTGGHAGNCGHAIRYSTLGGDPGKRWAGAVDSIPSWRRRVRQVKIEKGCGIQLCERVEDREGTVIYADPPYLEKGEAYTHDFESEDHQRLAQALRRFKKTRVVVSYYDDPRLADLYPGWQKIDCTITKALVQGTGRTEGRVDAPEVLLLNKSAAATPLFDLEDA